MIDKDTLRRRLDAMVHLPEDWDGFGTGPISEKVFIVANQLVDFLGESLFGCQFFVGVQTPGSLFIEFDLNRKILEMTIAPDGLIHCDEFIAGKHCGSDSFYLDRDRLQSLLDS